MEVLLAALSVFLLVLAAGGWVADRLTRSAEREDAWKRNHARRA